MRRYYIAGPMTGLPEYNYPAFEEAATRLRRRGRDVCSPHEINTESAADRGCRQWYEYMVDGVRALLDCTDIVLLDGWELSRGAALELEIAKSLGMAVYTYRPVTRSPLLLVQRGKREVHLHARDHRK
jgi:hypothetical protein